MNVLKPIEVRGYDSKMIQEGEFSFEEIRARNWYSKPKIFKPSLPDLLQPKYRLPISTHNEESISYQFPTIQTIENLNNLNSNSRPVHDITAEIDDEDVPGLGITVNPDDLTHINVFKDNTADLREISKLVKANKTQSQSQSQKQESPKKTTTDWFLKDIMMSFSPIKKKPHLHDDLESSENKKNSLNNSPSTVKTLKTGTDLTTKISKVTVSNESIPLSVEGDIKCETINIFSSQTHETVDYSHLMDPFDLEFKVAQCEAVLSQIASAIPNLNLRLNESAASKVRSFEKSLGRDGSGPNHTVSSLRIASGHFFMERKLGEGGYGKVFLGVDLMKDDEVFEAEGTNYDDNESSDVNQVAIKIETPASVWESYIIFRIQSHLNKISLNNNNSSSNSSNSSDNCYYNNNDTGNNYNINNNNINNNNSVTVNHNINRHFPRLISASIYSDVSFLVMDYYEQGSLLSALNVYRQQNTNNLDESIVLFYAAELLKLVLTIHEGGILHTDIKLENLLILSPHGSTATTPNTQSTWSSNFKRDGSEGWKDRGLVLIDFGRAVDLKLLKDEEESRFFIKTKHESFNGSPRIAKGLDVSHEMDWYGVADCLHWLLFQKSLSLVSTVSINSNSNALKFKLTNSFKRYWQIDIWESLFQDLLNPPLNFSAAIEKFKFHLDKIFVKLENWRKTPSLKSLLTRQEIMLYENKK